MDTIILAVQKVGTTMLGQLPYALGLAAFFTIVSRFSSQACNPGRPWWKSRDLIADTHYLFILPLILPYFSTAVAVVFMLLFWGESTMAQWPHYMTQGHGILSGLPLYAQGIIYVVGSDFLLYWAHRLFHFDSLWPFHAVHHSAEDVDWTTTYRAHPVDNILRFGVVKLFMLVIGISPEVSLMMVPFDILSAAFVHSNLNWTLGPLKYVIATPVFHRWHHTSVDEGGKKNYSPTFSFWDVFFGTFYMPEGKLPQEYGNSEPNYPKDFIGQMIVPFKHIARNIAEDIRMSESAKKTKL